jgi:heterodisulfide reductase subunit B
MTMAGLRFGFFLGCIAPNRYPGIEVATRKIAPMLGIELIDLPRAACCPAPGVFRSFDPTTWLALAARNLSISEELGVDIFTVCNGCYGSLREANETFKEEPEKLVKVNEILKEVGRTYRGSIQVRHIAEVLYKDVGVEKIRSIVKKQLGLKVAVHYGCHILKPTKHRGIDSAERPRFVDEMVEALGCESVQYKDRMLCCGAGGGLRTGALDVSLDMTLEKLRNVHESGADLLVDICPFCHLQFDYGQIQIRDGAKEYYAIPVLHYVQLLGLAAELNPKEIGVYSNFVSVDQVIKKIGM